MGKISSKYCWGILCWWPEAVSLKEQFKKISKMSNQTWLHFHWNPGIKRNFGSSSRHDVNIETYKLLGSDKSVTPELLLLLLLLLLLFIYMNPFCSLRSNGRIELYMHWRESKRTISFSLISRSLWWSIDALFLKDNDTHKNMAAPSTHIHNMHMSEIGVYL